MDESEYKGRIGLDMGRSGRVGYRRDERRLSLTHSRTPSRSPHRATTDPVMQRSASFQPGQSDLMALPPPAASSSYNPPSALATNSSFPSATPQEPTIREVREEAAAAAVSRRATTSNGTSGNGASRSARDKARIRMVGDWQLQKTLGAGSMGKVKLATNIHTKEKVGSHVRIKLIAVRCQDHPPI